MELVYVKDKGLMTMQTRPPAKLIEIKMKKPIGRLFQLRVSMCAKVV